MERTAMPRVDLHHLRELLPDLEDYRLAVACVNGRTGQLRASKPTVRRDEPATSIAAYAWRMAAFSVSPLRQHQCMPVCAEFDLPGSYASDERLAAKATGDRIEKALVSSVPVRQWHGVYRWGCALGQLGTPELAADGSIIYR